MKFSVPPSEYSVSDQVELRRVLERSDATNHKRESDVEIGNGRLILTRSVDGTRYEITVGGTGATVTLTATLLA